MKAIKMSLLLALCLGACLSVARAGPENTGDSSDSGPKLAIDYQTTGGVLIKAPFHKFVSEPFSPELRAQSAEDVTELMTFLQAAIDELVGSGWWGFTKGLAKISTKMIGVIKRQKDRHAASGLKVSADVNYGNDVKDMFKTMLQKSQKMADEMKNDPKDIDGLKKKLRSLTEAIKEAASEHSPVTGYVDWPNTEINGEPFIEACSKVMAECRHNGYGGTFNLVDVLINKYFK